MAAALRPATPADFAHLRTIAEQGGSPDADDDYFSFVASEGQLIVAELDEQVIGFAGAVPVGVVAMVSDLFVDAGHRARGVGRSLLGEVLGHETPRMTFSSTHPAALSLYARFGMPRRERLLTLQADITGGGAPLVPRPWQHDRHELVAHYRRQGATVTDHAIATFGDDAVFVWRVAGDDGARAIDEVLRSCPSPVSVTLSVLESDPIVPWLTSRGFGEVDDDVWCASPDVERTVVVTCVHRGFC